MIVFPMGQTSRLSHRSKYLFNLLKTGFLRLRCHIGQYLAA